MIENIRIALGGLNSNKLRSILTMLGIIIGVAAVIVLISVGQAIQGFIVGTFANIGTNLVFVRGEEDNFGRVQTLAQSDVDALDDIFNVPDALRVVPQYDIAIQGPDNPENFTTAVQWEGNETDARVFGTTPGYVQALNRSVVAGRFIDEQDIASGARVAVMGQQVIRNLFGEDVNPVGRSILIRDVRVEVIGVLNEVGSGGNFAPGGGADNWVAVPLTTAQTRLAAERSVTGERVVNSIVVQARDDNSIDAVVEQVRETLRSERGLRPNDEDDFAILSQEELLESLGTVTGLLTIFLGVVAGISLLVGGIGIMNIMLVTVTERTREIGLRKAVGAQRGDILMQFLTESIVLSLFGGIIGILIATGLSALASSLIPDLDVDVQLGSVLFAAMVSIMIGVFFGVYPANRAAGLSPIDALRYE